MPLVVYTNDYRHDVDCHHFAPALISSEQPGYPVQQQGSGFNEGWTFVWKGLLTTIGTSILQPLRTLLEKPTPNYDVNVTPVPQVARPVVSLGDTPRCRQWAAPPRPPRPDRPQGSVHPKPYR